MCLQQGSTVPPIAEPLPAVKLVHPTHLLTSTLWERQCSLRAHAPAMATALHVWSTCLCNVDTVRMHGLPVTLALSDESILADAWTEATRNIASL